MCLAMYLMSTGQWLRWPSLTCRHCHWHVLLNFMTGHNSPQGLLSASAGHDCCHTAWQLLRCCKRSASVIDHVPRKQRLTKHDGAQTCGLSAVSLGENCQATCHMLRSKTTSCKCATCLAD